MVGFQASLLVLAAGGQLDFMLFFLAEVCHFYAQPEMIYFRQHTYCCYYLSNDTCMKQTRVPQAGSTSHCFMSARRPRWDRSVWLQDSCAKHLSTSSVS